MDKKLMESLEALNDKFEARGQSMLSYLEGLLHSEFLTYWDYVHLETLLSLQNPRTQFPDEKIFIVYHQITELYFNLCLHELDQIADKEDLTIEFLTERVRRVNAYFTALISSYEIMVDGMDKEQFLKFRMALLPASGFQSAQYRKIEISNTSLLNLVNSETRKQYAGNESDAELYNNIYWKQGATELETGKKTLTLKMFEDKYDEELLKLAIERKQLNISALSQRLGVTPELKKALREMDVNVNINWPLSHYKSAVRYLQRDPADVAATGGTNWQKYLPPKYQGIIFFPHVWTPEEQAEWGKKWVEKNVFDQ